MLASLTLVQALSKPTPCTLQQLLDEYDLSDSSLLSACIKLEETITTFNLVIDPPIGKYGLDYQRTLKLLNNDDTDNRLVTKILETGETHEIELKSSLTINTKKRQFNPDLRANDCVDPALMLQAAKELASFLNATGGTILFGVTDDHEVVGCNDDFESFSKGGSQIDKASLLIRQIVEKHFVDAEVVLQNLRIAVVVRNNMPLIMIQVAPRRALTFLKAKDPSQLYIRSGTSAVPIHYHDIEKYFHINRL